jgi:hypothetical protein
MPTRSPTLADQVFHRIDRSGLKNQLAGVVMASQAEIIEASLPFFPTKFPLQYLYAFRAGRIFIPSRSAPGFQFSFVTSFLGLPETNFFPCIVFRRWTAGEPDLRIGLSVFW